MRPAIPSRSNGAFKQVQLLHLVRFGETNRWKLLDDALTETGSFEAENVDGFFSYDGESYYFLRDGVLHCQNVAGGEAQPVTALSQLRFAELTAYDAASGRMAALFLLSPYGSV